VNDESSSIIEIDQSTMNIQTMLSRSIWDRVSQPSDLEPGYRPDIDGLRAIAVSSVVFFHANLSPFFSGFVGVDIFFVISGYLIGGIIIRGMRTGRYTYAGFYARRARRILPVLILVILVTCLLGCFILDAKELFFVGGTSTSALLAVSNISFWRLQDYFASDSRLSPLLMTWSLGIEEQFYLFFPILTFGIVRLANDRLLPIIATLTAVSFAFSVWCTSTHPAAAFYLLPSRAWELGAGVLLAAWQVTYDVRHSRRLSFLKSKLVHDSLAGIGALFLVIAIVGFDENTVFPGFVALLPVLGTAALIFADRSSINCHVLSRRPIVFVGLVSYSWYLWHWPLMSYLRIIVPTPPSTWQLAMMALASFVLAVLSWHFVERPFRRVGLPSRPTLLRYALVLSIAIVPPVAIKLSKGLPQRLPEQTREVEATVGAGLNGPCSAAWNDSKPNLSADCVVDITHRPAVALIGDSHAWALGPGLRELTARQNLGFRMFTKPACPPLLNVSVWSKNQPALTEACASFMRISVQQLVSDSSVKVVVLAGLWDNPLDRYVDAMAQGSSNSGSHLLRAGLENMVGALQKGNKKVILLGDTPYWRFDPKRVALARSMPLRGLIFCLAQPGCESLFQGSAEFSGTVPPDPRSVEIVREVAAAYATQYIDLSRKFCSLARCIFQRENELLFIDHSHLSGAGAKYAIENLELLSNE
jgi:peptidoglycan/LPS O-acetylase OafA/YrhL